MKHCKIILLQSFESFTQHVLGGIFVVPAEEREGK